MGRFNKAAKMQQVLSKAVVSLLKVIIKTHAAVFAVTESVADTNNNHSKLMMKDFHLTFVHHHT